MYHRLIVGTINRYDPEDGWVNLHMDVSPRGIWWAELHFAVQPEVVGDVRAMPQFRDGMFDEVRMHHVLEHLPPGDAPRALAEIRRVLVRGGVLDVEVPNFEAVVEAWQAGRLDDAGLQQWVYGEDLGGEGDTHRAVWTPALLGEALFAADFKPFEDTIDAGYAIRIRVTA